MLLDKGFSGQERRDGNSMRLQIQWVYRLDEANRMGFLYVSGEERALTGSRWGGWWGWVVIYIAR
jgi:hypothetical protein